MLPIWSCSEWGLPCHGCYQPRGALLPHHFTLTGAEALRRYVFCGTFRRLTPPRRYLAPCPVEPGLSSMTQVTATVRPASSSIVRHGRNGSRLRSGVEFSDNCEQKTKPLYLIIFIDIYYYSTPPLRGERCQTGLQATYKRKSI